MTTCPPAHVRAVLTAALAATLAAPARPAPATAPLSQGPAYKLLHAFPADNNVEGTGPMGALVQGADGDFYGTTFYNGATTYRCDCTVGGTVFRMTFLGEMTVLHTFMGNDGIGPNGGLAVGPDGAFYGLASGGGDYGGGTAFRIDAAGAFTRLHSFGGPAQDGRQPWLGALALGADGNFYGTASDGGAGGLGVLFRMTPAGAVTVLHAFTGAPADGATPRGGLTRASDGNLYGTTLCGGALETDGRCGGTLFAWSPTTGYRLVQSFDPDPANRAGHAPQAAPTEMAGYLYGTTSQGGDADAGTVFRVPLAGGALATLHAFAGGASAQAPNGDGRAPAGRLVLANDGRLYGVTSNGGPNRTVHPDGDGTLFSIGSDGSYALVYAFGATTADGSHPVDAPVKARNGTLFGTTENGDIHYTGTTWRWIPSAATNRSAP